MAVTLARLLLSYPLHRAAVAGLSFGATILGARVLSAEQFSALVTAAFLAKFLQILNLGAISGYFVSRYSGRGPLAGGAPGAERRFVIFYLLHLGGLGLIAAAVAAIWLQDYRTGVIAFLLLLPLFVTEPALRYRRSFSFSLAPEFLLSFALLAAVAAHAAGLAEARLTLVYLAVIGALCAAMLGLVRRRLRELGGPAEGFGSCAYMRVMGLGWQVYMGTALFLVASSMDRLLLPLYGGDEQIAIYFLAYQLCVGSMIFVTALNFVNTVNLGEARQKQLRVDPALLRGKMRTAALVAGGSYLALVASGVALEAWFLSGSFEGLARVVAVLGAGLALFFFSSTVTPIVAYFHRQLPLTISMGCVAAVLAANNAWAYWNGLGAAWLATGTALALGAQAGFAVWFTFSVLRHQEDGAQAHAD